MGINHSMTTRQTYIISFTALSKLDSLPLKFRKWDRFPSLNLHPLHFLMESLLGKCCWLGTGIRCWFSRHSSDPKIPVPQTVLRPGLCSLASSGHLGYITLFMSLSKAFCKMGETIEGEQGFLSEKGEAGTTVTCKANFRVARDTTLNRTA